MKTVLIVLGIIVFVFLIALLLPIRVGLGYDNLFFLNIRYFGITVFDSEKREKQKKGKTRKKDTQDNTPKKENFFIKTYKQKGLNGTISYFSNILAFLLKKLWWIVKHLKFRRFKLDITVATSNAANTAIDYGKICAAIYPLISLLQSIADFKPKEVNIHADFDKTKTEFNASVIVTARVVYLLIAAIGAFIYFIKLQRKEREKYERKQP